MFADHKSTAWLRSNPTLKQDDSEQVAQANIQVAFQSLKDGKVPLPEQHSVIFTIKKKVFCSSDGIYVSVWYNDDTNLEGVASTPQDRAALNSLQKWAKKKNTWNSAQWNLKSWAGTTLCTRAGWGLSGWNVAVLKKAWEPWKAIGMWLTVCPWLEVVTSIMSCIRNAACSSKDMILLYSPLLKPHWQYLVQFWAF